MGKLSVKTDLSLFYNQIDNLIALAMLSGQQYSYGNVGEYQSQGVQAGFGWVYKALKINSTLSYIGRYNQSFEQVGVPKFNYSPELSASLEYQIKKKQITLAAFYKYNGRVSSYQMVDEVLQQSFVSAYQWLDASIQKSFWHQRLSLTLGCKNLLNVTSLQANVVGPGGAHSSGSGAQALATGRNYFIKLNWKIFK